MSKSNPPSHMRLSGPLLRVMLVDDEPTVVRTLRRSLATQRPDWQIMVQAGPMQTLSALEREPIDVVISDYEMPLMNGIDLFRRMKRQHPTVLRVIISGKSKDDAGTIPPGLVHAWMPKTLSAVELAEALEELLVRRDRAKRRPRTG